jgi:hypothetical protein
MAKASGSENMKFSLPDALPLCLTDRHSNCLLMAGLQPA